MTTPNIRPECRIYPGSPCERGPEGARCPIPDMVAAHKGTQQEKSDFARTLFRLCGNWRRQNLGPSTPFNSPRRR